MNTKASNISALSACAFIVPASRATIYLPSISIKSTLTILSTMAFSFYPGLPPNASPRLKAIQYSQLSITALTLLATFLAAVIPHRHKAFTFGLLYPLILISCSTTFLVLREQRRARQGTLSKDKYVKYQLFKLFAAFGLGFVGFVLDFFSSQGQGCDKRQPGEQGLWLRCVKVNKWQGWILWLNVFNW